jgi:hypothetical protein
MMMMMTTTTAAAAAATTTRSVTYSSIRISVFIFIHLLMFLP